MGPPGSPSGRVRASSQASGNGSSRVSSFKWGDIAGSGAAYQQTTVCHYRAKLQARASSETAAVNSRGNTKLRPSFRKTALGSRLLCAEGKLQREDDVIHVIADRLFDYTSMLGELSGIDVEGAFDGIQSRADEMQRPPPPVISSRSRKFRSAFRTDEISGD